MILPARNLSVGSTSKPCMRAFALLSLLIALLFVYKRANSSLSAPEYGFSSAPKFQSPLFRTPRLRFSTYRYEAPQDLVVPQWHGRELQAESLIGKVTILFHGKDPTYMRAIRTHQAHNRRFGYPLLALRHAILDGIWSKPAYILAIILEELRKPDGQRLKWLFWFDADTVVTNPKIPLEVFLPPEELPHLHLLVTADPHGLNNGIFFVKVHPWSVELLSAVIAYLTFRPQADLKYRDQTALVEVLKEKAFAKNYVILPQRWINAYQDEPDGSRTLPFQIIPGDLLVHFPGVPQRDERIRFYLDIAERHWPKWEKDLESTTYPKEIKDFWIEQQGIKSKERNEAQRMVSKAREYFSKCEQALNEYRGRLDSGELEVVEDKMKKLRDAMEDDRDDLEIVTEVLDNLKKSMTPVKRLIKETMEALHDEAKGLVSQSEQLLSQGVEDPRIMAQKETLQRLLAEAPDDKGAIRQAVDDLGKTTADVQNKTDKKQPSDTEHASQS